MPKEDKPERITFPLKLESTFSEDIDACVFHTKSPSKHQYILNAIKEKVERDKERLSQIV